jgi:hypothetical protein
VELVVPYFEQPGGWTLSSHATQAALDIRPIAGALGEAVAPYIEEKDLIERGRVAAASAWTQGLSMKSLERLLRMIPGVTELRMKRLAVEGIAVTSHTPAVDVPAFLRARRMDSDRVVSLWAMAGLARRDIDCEKTLKPFLAALSATDAEARVAAADGLLHALPKDAPPPPEVQKALADPDLRVRWRVAALMLERDSPESLTIPELARGVDGPCDVERLAALEACASLGKKARALRDRIEEWSRLPSLAIASAAKDALAALDAK